MEAIITCKLCKKLFTEPKMLMCQHHFCAACLQTWFNKSRSETRLHSKHMQCPTCKSVEKLPRNGPQGLPDGHYVVQVIEVLQNSAADRTLMTQYGVAHLVRYPGVKKENREILGFPRIHGIHDTRGGDADYMYQMVDEEAGYGAPEYQYCPQEGTDVDDGIEALPEGADEDDLSEPLRCLTVDGTMFRNETSSCGTHGFKLSYFCRRCGKLSCLECLHAGCLQHEVEPLIDVEVGQTKLNQDEKTIAAFEKEEIKIRRHAACLLEETRKNEIRLLRELEQKRDEFKSEVSNITRRLDMELMMMRNLRDTAKQAVDSGDPETILSLLPVLQSRVPKECTDSHVMPTIPDFTVEFKPEFSPRLGDLIAKSDMNDHDSKGKAREKPEGAAQWGAQVAGKAPTVAQEVLKKEEILKQCMSKVQLVWDMKIAGFGSDITLLPNDIICLADRDRGVMLYNVDGMEIKSSAERAQLDEPSGVAFHPYLSALLVTTRDSNMLKVLDADTLVQKDDLDIGDVEWPCGVAVMPAGHIVVSEVWIRHGVSVHDISGKCLVNFGSQRGSTLKQFNWPEFVTVDHHNRILVADSRNHVIKVFDEDGRLLHVFGKPQYNPFSNPRGVCVDDRNNVVLIHGADGEPHQVSLWSPDGRLMGHLVEWDITTQKEQTGAMRSLVCKNNKLVVLGEKCMRMYEYKC